MKQPKLTDKQKAINKTAAFMCIFYGRSAVLNKGMSTYVKRMLLRFAKEIRAERV